MSRNTMDDYLHNDANKKDALEALPEQVAQELQAHLELYQKDPVKAHMWDPIVIGVPGGPVKTLLLTHTGRKSGRTLQNVLQYFELNGQVAIVASRGGTVEHPFWYLNLVANPHCEIQIGESARKAVARTIEGDERAEWWEKVVVIDQPIQRQYQSRTSRIIPVVVFDPV